MSASVIGFVDDTKHPYVFALDLDSHLRWSPHVCTTATKAAAQMAAVMRSTQSTWGTTFARARQIYAAVVRPAISYAAEVWHDPNDRREAWPKQAGLPAASHIGQVSAHHHGSLQDNERADDPTRGRRDAL